MRCLATLLFSLFLSSLTDIKGMISQEHSITAKGPNRADELVLTSPFANLALV